MRVLSAPRLLPLTMMALAAVLATKAAWLARAGWPAPVTGGLGMVTAARAAGPDKGHETGGHGAGHPDTPTKPREVAEPQAEPPAPAVPPVGDSERAVLLDLRQRRDTLDKRDATVTAREQVLKAAEQKIATRVDEMRVLQQRLESLDSARQKREDESWQGLVKLYETMKPQDAAKIFNELTMSVLLPLVAHMKETKAAPILAAMAPDKARDLTGQLAKSRTRADQPAEPAAAPPTRVQPGKS